MKNEKGITLIALVITVIIMLILAGVAIATLINDGGLFDKTLKSAEAFENASQKEAKQLDELMNEIDGYIGNITTDKKAPSVAKLEVSNITETGFTLTATGEDDKGIAKYEIYIKNADGTFTLEKTIESADTTVSYEVTGKTPQTSLYEYKVIVYDTAENTKESGILSVGAQKIAKVVKIGDYINYDAGVWTQEDLNKITSSTGSPLLDSTVSDATSGNQTLPTVTKTFGGFELGQSRNTNAVAYTNTSGTVYTPKTEGWRVWDINNSTGVVTLISAGQPETYYHNNNATTTLNILQSRNYTMYVNEYATSAKVLSGAEAISWYNARFGTNYGNLVQDYPAKSTFFNKQFTTDEPISLLSNGSLYWLTGNRAGSNYLYAISLNQIISSNGQAYGIRVMVTLKSDVLVIQNNSGGSVANPWKIAK